MAQIRQHHYRQNPPEEKISMNKKSFLLASLLFFTIPLDEAHNFFYTPEVRERQWFLLSDTKQDIQWYVKHTTEHLTWIIVFLVWFIREKVRSRMFSTIILIFLVYRICDLIMYWVNRKEGGFLYSGFVYGVILVTIFLYYKKWKKQ